MVQDWFSWRFFPSSSHYHSYIFLYNNDLGDKSPALLTVAGPPSKRNLGWSGPNSQRQTQSFMVGEQLKNKALVHSECSDTQVPKRRQALLADPEPRGLAERSHFLSSLARVLAGL